MKNSRETRICPICKNDFVAMKISKQTYCSLRCQIVWQKENPKSGKENPHYKHSLTDEQRKQNCEWCGEIFYPKVGRIGLAKFCSLKCKRAWYAEVWSKNPEWKEKKSIQAAKQMKDRKQNESAPQAKINIVLDKLGIKYEREKCFHNLSVDNYLIDFNLIIEVMGTFWHCDVRKYDEIVYPNQKRRIKMDKIKSSYFKTCRIPVLYLWEEEVTDNLELCEKLILDFVSKNGKLENYHSFNFNLLKNKKIKLNKEIIIPYMEYTSEEIQELMTIELKEKMSKKQKDKWIIFQCENCGKEKEQLFAHYKKSKNHFCSLSCSSRFLKSRNTTNLD